MISPADTAYRDGKRRRPAITFAGSVADRVGRCKVIVGGWLANAVLYLGFALAERSTSPQSSPGF